MHHVVARASMHQVVARAAGMMWRPGAITCWVTACPPSPSCHAWLRAHPHHHTPGCRVLCCRGHFQLLAQTLEHLSMGVAGQPLE